MKLQTDTTSPAGILRGTDGYKPFDLRVTPLAGGQWVAFAHGVAIARGLPRRVFRERDNRLDVKVALVLGYLFISTVEMVLMVVARWQCRCGCLCAID